MREIGVLIIHHSYSAFGDVETIRGWHTDPDKAGGPWSDIGYHLVGLNGFRTLHRYELEIDGAVEPGRDFGRVGAHDGGQNQGSLGYCLVGRHRFTLAQLLAVHRTFWALRAAISPRLTLEGHFENEPGTGTECPGDRLRPIFHDFRKWVYDPLPDTTSAPARTMLRQILSPAP